ncbi:MAG: hypothetical protein J1E07_05455 [Treponema sp.]|nr:hypothetical protein [Treponema sp.]
MGFNGFMTTLAQIIKKLRREHQKNPFGNFAEMGDPLEKFLEEKLRGLCNPILS